MTSDTLDVQTDGERFESSLRCKIDDLGLPERTSVYTLRDDDTLIRADSQAGFDVVFERR